MIIINNTTCTSGFARGWLSVDSAAGAIYEILCLCMYVCVYVCVYVCLYVFISVCMCVCMCVYACMCGCMCTCMCAYVHACVVAKPEATCNHTCMHNHTCMPVVLCCLLTAPLVPSTAQFTLLRAYVYNSLIYTGPWWQEFKQASNQAEQVKIKDLTRKAHKTEFLL